MRRSSIKLGLRHADCLGDSGMSTLPTDCVDVTMTDPPYSERTHERHARVRRGDGYVHKPLSFASITQEELARAAQEIVRLTMRWIVLFTDEWDFPAWVEHLEGAGARYVRQGVWAKHNPSPQKSGDRPCQGHELILLAHAQRGRRMKWNGGGRSAVYHGPTATDPGRHPAEKPAWLVEALMRDFTERAEVVLDPFAGRATVPVQAKRLGRRWVAFERSPTWYRRGRDRIAVTREQLELGQVVSPRYRTTGAPVLTEDG